MERAIKFRVWSPTEGMIKSSTDCFISIDSDGTLNDTNIPPVKVMQFTGLLDKNGREIYEGDVVRVDWHDDRYAPVIGVVKWNNKDCCYEFGAGLASELFWSHEIIGNIHENPELTQ